MNIEEDRHGAVTVLKPRGPITADDAAGFLARVRESLRSSLGRFIVDVSGVPYVDSSGLEAMIDAGDELEESGLSLKVCGMNETLREVLDLTGHAGRFERYEDVQTAVRSFL